MMTTLVNLHDLKLEQNDPLPDGYVYIGREGHGFSGYFGNPPENGSTATLDRNTIVKNYRAYFYKRMADDEEFFRRVNGLKGKVLVCFCVPQLCHGMILIEYLEGVSVQEQSMSHRQADTERKRAIANRKHKRNECAKPKVESTPDIFDDQ